MVYDFVHIGNLCNFHRDIIRQYLNMRTQRKQVMNITDIESEE